MRLPTNELAYMFGEGEMRRNIVPLLRYGLFLAAVVLLFAAVFQLIMVEVEGQSHSWITAVYWTLVTMSTLGFGDVTFSTDLGRLFSLLVLLTGIVLLLVVLPFTFIRFLYAPWLEAQVRMRAPRRLASTVKDHVIIARHDEIATDLIERLGPEGIPYFVIEPDARRAGQLLNDGVSVVTGDLDSRTTYEGLMNERARLLRL